jgi:AcrR family transcriptional regulator
MNVARGRFATSAPDTEPVRSAPTQGTAERRLRILQAAAGVICERGFADTTTAEVAQRAGVSGGTVIYHFRTLDRLLVEALKHAEDQFYEAAEQVVEREETPRLRLRALVEWVLSPEHDNPQLWTLWIETWSQATRHPEVAATRAMQEEKWRAMIASIVADLPLSPEKLDRFAVGFAAFMDGLTIQVALHDQRMSPELARDMAMAYADSVVTW